jgi:pimeloyl-ACP methyl ester carboxylesterase
MGCRPVISRAEHVEAEAELLSRGVEWWRSVHPSGAEVSWSATDVPLPSLPKRNLHIHTIEYTCGTPDPDVPPLVCMHGFGFGAGLYYAAIPALAERWTGRLFSIDTLGCGLSSRPKWPHPYGHRCPPKLAEKFFVDAIEAWRQQMGLETMVLLGHSMGGLLAIAYAERHVGRQLKPSRLSLGCQPVTAARLGEQAMLRLR